MIICVLAIVLRIIYFIHLKESVFFGNYFLDSGVINAWAQDIVGGNFWGHTAFFRPPLYAYVVAFIYKIFGSSPPPIIVFQNLLGLSTIIMVYFYTRTLFGEKAAFLAGVVTSCWPTLFYFEGELMTTSLSVFFSVASLFLLHRAIEAGIPRRYFVAGVLLGLAAITNSTFLPLAVIIPVYFALSRGKPKPRRVFNHWMIYLAGLIIPIIPITVRNAAVAHDFVVIATQGGANFYVGNSEEADGISVQALGPVTRAGTYYDDNIWTSSVEMAQYKLGRELKDSEVSSYWFKEALKEMAHQPARAVGLLIKKFFYFWQGQEIFNNKNPYSSGEYSWIMRLLLWNKFLKFPSGLLFPLMLVGIYFAIRMKQEALVPLLWLLIYSVTISMFFVCSRFRQPVVPVAIIFAAYGVVQFTETIRRKKMGQGLVAASIFLSSLIILNIGGNIESTINLSQERNMLGIAYSKAGAYDKAIENFEAALALLPDNVSVFGGLAEAEAKAGRLNDAERTLKKALALYPQFSAFNYNLGLIYYVTRRYREAKPLLYNAIKYDPKYALPYLLLGTLYEQEGNQDSARYIYDQLLRQDPNNSSARQRLLRLDN
jgi:4-amino-4-deoxy-L-arabinose transferase-like glycosyltransferase